MEDSVKITIITVCKNSERFLVKTIESVISQTYKNIEYIVIDGKSDDHTIDIIRRYSSRVSFRRSEKELRLYFAISFCGKMLRKAS